MDADVVVIGAGALGLATALHCAMSGRFWQYAHYYDPATS
jgi:glycine/D-amino acid oxidase-like deaminating enzyme